MLVKTYDIKFPVAKLLGIPEDPLAEQVRMEIVESINEMERRIKVQPQMVPILELRRLELDMAKRVIEMVRTFT